MAVSARHVMVCYLGSGSGDAALRGAAELCARDGATLSVVVPVVDAVAPRGCCGIQGEQWRRLVDEAFRDDAQRATEVLAAAGRPPTTVAIETGRSMPEIVLASAQRLGCDVVAVARKRRPWSAGFSLRQLAALAGAAPVPVIAL